MMKITVTGISEEGLNLDETLKFEGRDDGLLSVEVKLALRRIADEDVMVSGKAIAHTSRECSRCLNSVEESVPFDIELAFCPDPEDSPLESDLELSPDDLSTVFYSGNVINLSDSILEQALMAMPMKPLCREDCAGLCATCGANLNEEQCTCTKQRIDPRMAALEKLLDKKKP